ncbi:AMP-binding protein [Kitasatospora sp. A2-31]|uniref:AMP-binding protein n=1 Tax=Kitasatospora sp. A2-31 TaxID=2916414 RepID=UPI001EECDC34|nr:AMP-binding protein [Kitasatospora sp. A2-31]MCG6495597.1 AMP-binding protein [Kitasatospora sp. A2-31]
MAEPRRSLLTEERTGRGEPSRYAAELFAGLRRWPGRTALRDGDRLVSFGELVEQSSRIARALEDMGMTHREGVVCLAGNSPEHVAVRLAAHLLGCRFVPLHAGDPADVAAARAVAAAQRPAVFVVDRRGAAALGAPEPGVLSLGVPGFGTDLSALAARMPGGPMRPRAREQDVALVAYSRGTTGPRRGAVHRFAAMNVTWRRPHEGDLGDFPAGVTTLAVSPLAGNGGEVALMLMRAGCTVMLMNGFDAGRVLATVASERITSTYLPAHHFTELVAHPDLDRTDLSSLRYLPYGNGPVPASVVRRAVEAFGPILSQNYVSSEIRAISLLRQEDHRAAAGPRPELLASVGQPLPAVDVRVCGPDGERRPAGRSGEIRLRAPHMTSGYWRDPAATRRALDGGWLRTGDVGRVDREGYLYLEGRLPG